jgi:hypothetical protein
MNISEEDFKKLYANLAPETQEDLKKQLGIKENPAPVQTDWWKANYQPAPSTPQSGTPIAPQRQRKIKPRRKHLWKWIIAGYLLIILSCVLPIILKMKP